MSMYGTHRNEKKAVASVRARMREQADERDAESAQRREREDVDLAARRANDPYFDAYGWTEDDIDEPATRRAIESVTEMQEQREEDRHLDADEDVVGDDGNRKLPPAERAVASVRKLMAKKNLLTDAEHEAEILDSLPDADDAARAARVKKVMPTRVAVEMVGKEADDLSDEELRDAMEAGIAADDQDHLDDDEEDEDDDDMGPGMRSGGLSY